MKNEGVHRWEESMYSGLSSLKDNNAPCQSGQERGPEATLKENKRPSLKNRGDRESSQQVFAGPSLIGHVS